MNKGSTSSAVAHMPRTVTLLFAGESYLCSVSIRVIEERIMALIQPLPHYRGFQSRIWQQQTYNLQNNHGGEFEDGRLQVLETG